MSGFKEVFKENEKVVLPIIIADSFKIARDKTQIALDSGADGIFLRKEGSADFAKVNGWVAKLRKNSDKFIGIYHPELRPAEIFRHHPQSSGVLVDCTEIRESISRNNKKYFIITREAEEIEAEKVKSGWQGLYFGGINFPNEPMVKELDYFAYNASKYVDVLVAAGNPADIGNIRISIASDFPLAVINITPEDVGKYKDKVNCFIIADIRVRDFVSAVKASL